MDRYSSVFFHHLGAKPDDISETHPMQRENCFLSSIVLRLKPFV